MGGQFRGSGRGGEQGVKLIVVVHTDRLAEHRVRGGGGELGPILDDGGRRRGWTVGGQPPLPRAAGLLGGVLGAEPAGAGAALRRGLVQLRRTPGVLDVAGGQPARLAQPARVAGTQHPLVLLVDGSQGGQLLAVLLMHTPQRALCRTNLWYRAEITEVDGGLEGGGGGGGLEGCLGGGQGWGHRGVFQGLEAQVTGAPHQGSPPRGTVPEVRPGEEAPVVTRATHAAGPGASHHEAAVRCPGDEAQAWPAPSPAAAASYTWYSAFSTPANQNKTI